MEKPEVLKNFYVIEGPDGSGKSSLIEEFKKNKWNKDLYFTSDPSHTEFGEGIRELMNKTKLVPEAIYHLLVADRIQTIDQIRKELANNKICIMDRYLWSARVS